MSSSSITDLGGLSERVGVRSVREAVIEPVTWVAFWSAIVLPFLYLPLLATGLQSESVLLAFLILVTLNAIAILIGHRHN